MTAIFTVLGATVLVMLLAAPLIIWRAFVLVILWGWFAVPLFHLPPVTMAQAAGVLLLAGFLTHQLFDKDDAELGRIVGLGILYPAFTLLIGWVITWWLP